MGLYNEILAGRFNRFAQKHFSMKGREGTPTLAADVALNLNFHGGSENLYLEGWDTFAINFQTTAPGVGNQSTVVLRNPQGSGVAVVVMRVQGIETSVTNTFATAMTFGYNRGGTPDQSTTGLNANICGIDFRGRPGPTAHVTFNSAALSAFGGTTFTLALGMTTALTPIEFLPPQIEVPLLPGTALFVQAGTANEVIATGWYWRERALEESEKT